MEPFAVAFLIVHLSSAAVGFSIAFYFLKLQRDTGITLLHVASSVPFFTGLTNLLVAIPSLFAFRHTYLPTIGANGASDWTLVDVFAVLSVLSTLLIYLSATIFLNGFASEYSILRITFSSFGLAVFVGLLIAALYGSPDFIASDVNHASTHVIIWSDLTWLIIIIEMIALTIWTLRDLQAALAKTISPRQTKQLKLMRMGSFISMLVGPFISAIGDAVTSSGYYEIGTWISEIIGYGLITFGIFFIMLSYSSAKRVLFLQPGFLYQLMIIKENGLLLYNHPFIKGKEGQDLSNDLLSAALTAIQALVRESLGAAGFIEKIVMRDVTLLIQFRGHAASVLILERDSVFLRHALRRFSEVVASKYQGVISHERITHADILALDEDIRRIFGLAL